MGYRATHGWMPSELPHLFPTLGLLVDWLNLPSFPLVVEWLNQW